MKKFFTSVPLQVGDGLIAVRYEAADNSRLQMEEETCFPIMTAINAYVRPGEAFAVVAVIPDSDAGRTNFRRLGEEIKALCARKGCPLPRIQELTYAEDQKVSAMADLFLKITEQTEDGDELYACMTFGTKPVSTALLLAVQYAYRAKKNVTIDGVVYGEIRRPDADRAGWTAMVYDETGLVQLSETIRLMAAAGAKNPVSFLREYLDV